MENEFEELVPWDSSDEHSTYQKHPEKSLVISPIEIGTTPNVIKTDTGYIANARVQKGSIVFYFNEFSFSKQSVDCVMEIELNVEDGKHPNFSQRIDMRSASAIKSLATDLNAAYGNKTMGYNWVLILNSVFNQVVKEVYTHQQPVSIVGRPAVEIPFLLYPFLQKDVSNMLFAESEAGKTWFALRAAISIATGKPFFNYQCTKSNKTLFIDYEDDIEVFTNRIRGLCIGMGVDFDHVAEYIEYYKPIGSLRNNVELLKRQIANNKFDLIIIDAGGDAAGGSPSDEEKVLDLFNALEEIPCTKLILHHEPKNVVNQASAFYGSMYWKARSRVAWRLEVETQEDKDKLIKATIQKRSNLPYIEPIYYKTQFEQGASLDAENIDIPSFLTVVTLNQVTQQQLSREKPFSESVVEVLEREGELTPPQIADLTGRDKSVVYKSLKYDRVLGTLIEPFKSGNTTKWRLKK